MQGTAGIGGERRTQHLTTRVARRLAARGPKRVLALDGGGTRGILTLAILAEIERALRERLGKPDLVLADYFDLIGGTSVGSMIATLLALGKDVATVRERFLAWAPRIFVAKGFGIVSAMFDARTLTGLVRREVFDWRLDDEKVRTGLCIVAKRVDTGSIWPIVNNPGDRFFDDGGEKGANDSWRGNRTFQLAELIRASTAAPRYFSPKRIRLFRSEVEGLFVDGGVSPHNNPALQLFMMAGISGYNLGIADTKGGEVPRAWALGEDKLLIVSVGTGAFSHRATEQGGAALDAVNALQGMMADNHELNMTLLQWLSRTPRERSWHIDSVLGDLSHDVLGLGDAAQNQPLLAFQRYDAPLEKDWLAANTGMSISESQLEWVRDFTSARELETMEKIGEAAAAKQVRAEHFPAAFDAIWRDGA